MYKHKVDETNPPNPERVKYLAHKSLSNIRKDGLKNIK